jgi:iron-sulfur cluster assembly protein
MVRLTDDAIGLIRRLTHGPGRSAEAGVRVATGPMAGTLTARVANHPHDEDQVIDDSGARVFLDTDATRVLDGKALHASVADDTVTFVIVKRPR